MVSFWEVIIFNCFYFTTIFLYLTPYVVSTYADLVLSNKLVVYDLDNEVVGWAEHNCKYLEPET